MSTPDSRPSRWAWAAHPAVLSGAAALLSFVFAAVAGPPPPLIAVAMSLPFFWYAAHSRWKDCIVWTLITVPFQYYFDIGGLALTHTEMYLFLFAGAYLLSRGFAEKSVLLPSALLVPALYGFSQFAPVVIGHPELAKHGVRTLAAVFFCPLRPGKPSRGRSSGASWAFSS